MDPRGGFAWRWVIAVVALAVIAVTLFVPPPGSSPPGTQSGETAEETAAEIPDDEAVHPVEPVPAVVPDTIRILVLNGTEMPNLAGRTQIQLIAPVPGDTVVVIAPWDPSNTETKPFPETVVISHLAERSAAGIIAGRLGLSDDSIVWEVPASPGVPGPDVTVCIGNDFTGQDSD